MLQTSGASPIGEAILFTVLKGAQNKSYLNPGQKLTNLNNKNKQIFQELEIREEFIFSGSVFIAIMNKFFCHNYEKITYNHFLLDIG